ncbi:L-lactate dehydrogenase complex protein LldG [Brevibacterium siliguriense]|uniref:L-lactate dehydrogenase complex protein LldG n=1 Tax=Brevibacterium siliguriense TaxID=1136497 RepID=A0A1H1RNT9_9MICO|nr:LUD domain-containing protein [Brevibacterium siliguriense]SDS37467.1 L-lactate dehydrogenase complex protein LldG [Brevibacterium siliguriense]
MTDNAREEILARIGEALGRRGGGEYVSSSPVTPARGTGSTANAAATAAESGYHHEGTHTGEGLIDLLIDRLVDYKANVHRADGDPSETIAELIGGHSSVVVPRGLDETWLRGFSGEVRVDAPGEELSVDDLDGQGGVVTASAVAIAQTGTIVLDGSDECGRRAITLVPDHHVCIVRTGDIVDIVPEAIARLDAHAPLTFISGPSATSDIELSRVEGVHGPRTLDVIILNG